MRIHLGVVLAALLALAVPAGAAEFCAVYEDKWGRTVEKCGSVLPMPLEQERTEWMPDRYGGGTLVLYDGELKYIYIREDEDIDE